MCDRTDLTSCSQSRRVQRDARHRRSPSGNMAEQTFLPSNESRKSFLMVLLEDRFSNNRHFLSQSPVQHILKLRK